MWPKKKKRGVHQGRVSQRRGNLPNVTTRANVVKGKQKDSSLSKLESDEEDGSNEAYTSHMIHELHKMMKGTKKSQNARSNNSLDFSAFTGFSGFSGNVSGYIVNDKLLKMSHIG